MTFDMNETKKEDCQEEWQSCVVCGVGKDGFSMVYSDEHNANIPVWNEFCSYGCMLAIAKTNSLFL